MITEQQRLVRVQKFATRNRVNIIATTLALMAKGKMRRLKGCLVFAMF